MQLKITKRCVTCGKRFDKDNMIKGSFAPKYKNIYMCSKECQFEHLKNVQRSFGIKLDK